MDKTKKISIYKKLYTLRRFDEMCLDLKMEDLIMDGFHPYWGEEACAIGVSESLNKDDYVFSNHRPQGHSLGKGTLAKQLFAEMLGRVGGVSDGIGGPMQWIDTENNFFCGSIVGSGIAIANGVAMVLKEEGKNRLCVSYFGDGASNTGSCHESMNLASIWELPVLYILENNQYAEAMPVKEFVSVYPISKRAAGYSIPAVTVDGNDIEMVIDTVKTAVESIRSGNGPYMVELMTYRVRGHYGGDPEHLYRNKEEVEEKIGLCPVKRYREKLLNEGVSIENIKKVEQEVEEELKTDQEWALAQRFPTVQEATSNVLFSI